MNKEEMFSELNAYLQHLNFANNCLVAYETLMDNQNNKKEILDIAAGFFTITRYALSKCLMIELAKLFCGSGNQKTIYKLINNVKANGQLFTSKRVSTICTEVNKEYENTIEPILVKLKARRDMDLAHNDPLYFDGQTNPAKVNYISIDECKKLIEFGFEFCISLLDLGEYETKVQLDFGADDLNDLLEKVSYSIQEVDK